MRKTFMGVRLRRLREEKGLTQAALARALELSPSYLNQLEQNQRPLTVAVLLKINAVFGVDIQRFAENDEAHLIAELREIAPDLPQPVSRQAPGGMATISLAEIKELVANMPAVARSLVALHQQRRHLMDQLEAMGQQLGGDRLGDAHAPLLVPGGASGGEPAATARAGGSLALRPEPPAHEEVRDFFFARNNHIAALDDAAELFARNWRIPAGAAAEAALIDQLRVRHGVHTLVADGDAAGADAPLRRYDAPTRTLHIHASLAPGQRAFQIATQFALLEVDGLITELIQAGAFQSAQAPQLARIGLANYYAGALLMPYTAFLEAARACRYDIEVLSHQFGVGFETVCHRLSTLQRAYNRGIPFFFIRVDRAGNISKRQSATHFHFSKIGGTCPLWNVYEAFSQPGRIVVQVARMPDGRTYLWLARTVVSVGQGWGKPRKTFSVALGCDIRHAHELVYSQGLNLHDPEAAVSIGMGCKVCERRGCTQRAFPPIGRPLQVDENQHQTAPYLAQMPP